MSLLQGAKRGVRIIALPLATPSPRTTPTHKASDHFTYYHFITPPPPESKANNWSTWATKKASDVWAGLGEAPEGHWKRRVFLYGERLVDRLDFEELALKSFDTSLGPKILPINTGEKVKPKDHPTIPLVYPPSACTSPLPHLRSLVEKRTPRHRNGGIFWIAISPLTAPFMLIPIVPNFPFFFCVWRAWSHYRAFKASQYLQAFVAQGAITPQENAGLDAIYAQYAPVAPDPEAPSQRPSADLDADASATPQAPGATTPSSSPSVSLQGSPPSSSRRPADAGAPPPRLLLTREAVPALERLLEIPPGSSFASDVYRALEQARLRLDMEHR